MAGSATEAMVEPVEDSPTADQLRFEFPLQLPKSKFRKAIKLLCGVTRTEIELALEALYE